MGGVSEMFSKEYFKVITLVQLSGCHFFLVPSHKCLPLKAWEIKCLLFAHFQVISRSLLKYSDLGKSTCTQQILSENMCIVCSLMSSYYALPTRLSRPVKSLVISRASSQSGLLRELASKLVSSLMGIQSLLMRCSCILSSKCSHLLILLPLDRLLLQEGKQLPSHCLQSFVFLKKEQSNLP